MASETNETKRSTLSLILATCAIVVSLAAVFSVLWPGDLRNEPESFGQLNQLGTSVATSGAINVTTASLQVSATNTARKYLAIVNTGSNYVCLNLNADKPAVDCGGIYLAANGGSYEINLDNLYTGAIQAIANTAAVKVTVVEE